MGNILAVFPQCDATDKSPFCQGGDANNANKKALFKTDFRLLSVASQCGKIFSTTWNTFCKQALRSARCARGGRGAPRRRAPAVAGSRHLLGCGRAVVAAPPDHAACGGCRECGNLFAQRGGGGLRFPPPWFSPRRPLFGGAPFLCGSSAGGQTHPRSVAGAPSLGATARRPFSLRAPPPFGSPRLKSPAAH